MEAMLEILKKWLTDPTLATVLRVAVLTLIALPVVYIIARFARKTIEKKYTQQTGMLIGKGIAYSGFILVMIGVLKEFGFNLSALLGTAGIFAIAIGFAAQTSLSNVISGLFLISEKPFAVGDLIKIGKDVGFVLSIDLMSVKIRAFDNSFIRVPNEKLIKTEVINLTRFPIRRIDLNVGVAYKEDPQRVMDVLKDIARLQPLCLDEPEPLIVFKAFGDSSLNFMIGVWCVRDDYLKVKNAMMSAIKVRFDKEGIEIPFPHRSIYTGSVTEPMPIRIVSGENTINVTNTENSDDKQQ